VTDFDGIREHYERTLEQHGESAEGVDYRDAQSQRSRFVRFEPLALGADSVCDLGCGVGALAGHLRERGFAGSYVGVDLVPASIELARARFPGERFEVGTDPVAADVVVASGIFNVRGRIGDAEWAAHIRRTLAAMWAAAGLGVAFNVLSRSVSPHLFSVDATVLLGWVEALGAARVTLDEDVGLGELTVVARRAHMG
jgi:SAM-dependent methyltransferase